MKTSIRIECTTAMLADAMSAIGGPDFSTIAAWNQGCYEGTTIPLRKMTGLEMVTVIGSATHAVVKTPESWIEDRFGSLGARQVSRLVELKAS